jgi:hypothetical protein
MGKACSKKGIEEKCIQGFVGKILPEGTSYNINGRLKKIKDYFNKIFRNSS